MSFEEDVIEIMPRLRIYALSLTRNPDSASDLVQTVVLRAIEKQHMFEPGTNLAAWLFRLQRNEFISEMRRPRSKNHADLDDPEARRLSTPAVQESRLQLRELVAKVMLLPSDQRQPLVLALLDGMDYETIGRVLGMSVGTVKSRISRARTLLGDV